MKILGIGSYNSFKKKKLTIKKGGAARRKVLRIGKDVKAKRERVGEILREGLNGQEFNVKVQLIQELIPIGLMHV